MIMLEVFTPNDMHSHIQLIAADYALGLSGMPRRRHGSWVKSGQSLRDTPSPVL